MSAPFVALTIVAALAISAGGAALSAWIWRIGRRERDPLGECGMGIFGLMGTASVMTFALHGAWTGSWEPQLDAPGAGDSFFVAALVGTVAGHVALLAWARGVGAPLAVRLPDTVWWGLGAFAGVGSVVVSLIWTWTAGLVGIAVTEQDIVSSVLDGPSGVQRAVVVAFVVGIAPVLEELVFRGFLQGCLTTRIGATGAAFASALLFGLFHLADPSVVPALVVIGGLLAWLRMRSGSVFPSMVGHMVNNAIALALALLVP